MDFINFCFPEKLRFRILRLFWIRFRTVPEKFRNIGLTRVIFRKIVKCSFCHVTSAVTSGKRSKISFFCLKTLHFLKTFLFLLKVNRLNFTRLVVRNSRDQYHHFETRKTENPSENYHFHVWWESFIRPFFTKNRLQKSVPYATKMLLTFSSDNIFI